MSRPRLFSSKGLSIDEAQINLTSLIDVVFVVLIMFILVAPLLELDRVQLAQAPLKEKKPMLAGQDSAPIVIYVRADNSIWIGKKKIEEKQLIHVLREVKQLHPQHIPQLFHDKKAQFGTYQIIKNAVEMAGFEQLDVILQPE